MKACAWLEGRTCCSEHRLPGQLQDAPEPPRDLELEVFDFLPVGDVDHDVTPAALGDLCSIEGPASGALRHEFIGLVHILKV